MRTALVTTTIHVPELLSDYARSAMEHGREIDIIVVGDKKSPPETVDYLKSLAREGSGAYRVFYLGAPEQERYLQDFPQLAEHLPWNCIQRRQVAILLAYELGNEVMITIDDDNFLVDEDFFKYGTRLGTRTEVDVVDSASHWFNICSYLEDETGRAFFPRGYPVTLRDGEQGAVSIQRRVVRPVVNAGLWLGDPDIDAVTRLACPPNVVGYLRSDNFALGNGTWAPFNSQNTALLREVLPAYFMGPFVGRYDDIWGSYVILRIADHLGDSVTFGHPLVRQVRNEHDLFVDLGLEKMGMQLTEKFTAWLRECTLVGTDYRACIHELMGAGGPIERQVSSDSSLTDEQRRSLTQFIDGYRVWESAMEVCSGRTDAGAERFELNSQG